MTVMTRSQFENRDADIASREDCVRRAVEAGFSRSDLWNPNLAIARIVAYAFGALDDAAMARLGLARSQVDLIILAAIRQDVDPASEDLRAGVRALPQLAREDHGAALEKIGTLLTIFAAYTRSAPQGRTSDDWTTHLELAGRAITGQVALIGAGKANAVILYQCCQFIAENFDALWD